MLFSIVVPVWGVEKYLEKCVNSILAEDFSDYELILVDDGSHDACPEICDRYAAKYGRVKVIHKENGGLVSARQAGVSAAVGKYIINVDSDDWIEHGFLKRAQDIIEKYDPDIISFAINFVTGDKIFNDPEPIAAGLYKENIKEIRDKMLLCGDMSHMHYFLWGKVFKAGIIRPHQLRTDRSISMGEDVTCLMPCYLDAKSVYISDETAYNCRCREDSMSRAFNPEHFEDIRLGVDILNGLCNADDDFKAAVNRYAVFMFFVLFASAAKEGSKEVVSLAKTVYPGTYAESFKKAEFNGITAKSKIAISLLKKRSFKSAYLFLRVCSKLKGEG